MSIIDKTIVIVSRLVDATIKEYQPDAEFLIFSAPQDLGIYLEQDPIRATTLFVTSDMLANSNSTLTYIRQLVCENEYFNVDSVLLLMEEDCPARKSAEYMISEHHLENWEIHTGSMTRAYVTEVINGTYRNDTTSYKKKAVYRIPRADYVKQQLRERSSLDEEYIDDENNLADIPDVEVPSDVVTDAEHSLEKYYVVGDASDERTAFALLAAQYLSETGKTLIVESDSEYHKLTEFVTKSEVDCYMLEVKDMYESLSIALTNIRKSEKKLIVVGAIERTQFSYRFITDLLYFSLKTDIDHLVVELPFSEAPYGRGLTVVMPSTVTGVLQACEQIPKSMIEFIRFVGVNLNQLPEVHVNSGVVMSYVLRDVLGEQSILCPVVTVTSLRLNGTVYDMGTVLSGGNSE